LRGYPPHPLELFVEAQAIISSFLPKAFGVLGVIGSASPNFAVATCDVDLKGRHDSFDFIIPHDGAYWTSSHCVTAAHSGMAKVAITVPSTAFGGIRVSVFSANNTRPRRVCLKTFTGNLAVFTIS